MRDNGNLLQQAVSDLVGEVSMETTSHLSADDLAAYHEGRLASDEDARLGDHLVTCAQCTSLLLDLERLQTDDLSGEVASEFELAAAWRGLGSKLNAEKAQPRRPVPTRRIPPTASLLAASLVAAVVGLSTWVHTLRGTLDELEQHHINALVVDIPVGIVRDGSVEEVQHVARITSDQQFFALVLNPPFEDDQEEYVIQVSDADGKTVWSKKGLRKNTFGSLSMILSRRQLTAERYRIRLYRSEALEESVTDAWLHIEFLP